MLTRYDSAPINNLRLDQQTGYLHADNVPIARVGVFPYINAKGQVTMEAKLPDDLLTDSTIETANSKPITEDHPKEAVNSRNSEKYMKGFTADNAHAENGMIKVDMTITNKDLIDRVLKGDKQELSIGFSTNNYPVKGNYKGMTYDSIQKNIQINHIAVVKRGRAGHSVRLTGDSAEMLIEDESEEQKLMETTKVHVNGTDITVASQDVDKLMKLDSDNSDSNKKIAEYEAKIKEYKSKVAALQANADEAQASADKSQAKADSLDKELATYKSKFEGDALDKAVEERMNLIKVVKSYVGDSYDFKGKSLEDMKKAAIKTVNDSIDLDNKSNEYVNAYFDSMVANRKPSSVVGYTGAEIKGDSLSDLESKAMEARNSIYNY
ncbi:hypothetical protein J2Z60_001063 [Lactobacillus colini]|uniref:DUF2213 domain-containing protein n=1 Tax=Lactobacillus colini TaxID=1819254 RepID=A0ABS4MDY0_9LACO|nr:DUF2213 domain-containing protein [Lactobacillus colini]MBP2057888.1 hypothetical protein [Lactobacillus colini]